MMKLYPVPLPHPDPRAEARLMRAADHDLGRWDWPNTEAVRTLLEEHRLAENSREKITIYLKLLDLLSGDAA
jgi:hypothetical protein